MSHAQPVLDAVNALRGALDTFAAAIPAASSGPLEVGQEIDLDTFLGLPVGSSARDKDGDVWYVRDGGHSLYYADGHLTGCEPEQYTPFVLESLPEPEPVPASVAPASVKVGDRVIVKRINLPGGLPRYEGREGTVTAKTSYGFEVNIDGPDGGSWGVTEVEPVPAAPTFKDGDKVKINALSRWGSNHIGEVGEVENADWSGDDPTYTVLVRVDSRGLLYRPEDLELAPAEDPTPEPEPFKKGDKVRATGTTIFGRTDVIGRTGVVENPDWLGDISVRMDVSGGDRLFRPENLARVVEEPTPTTVTVTRDGMNVYARPSSLTGGARVEVDANDQGRGYVHLTAEQTRQLGQTLIAIADANS